MLIGSRSQDELDDSNNNLVISSKVARVRDENRKMVDDEQEWQKGWFVDSNKVLRFRCRSWLKISGRADIGEDVERV